MTARAALSLMLVVGCAHGRNQATQPDRSSSTIITAEDIARSPGMSLEQLLVTRVPGLTLTRAADGHMVIRIRGMTTIHGDQEPLFILNGIPMASAEGGGGGGNLSAINPYDVEYIEVLRDAAQTSMYGVRGANGVIIIKTKSS